MSVDYERGGNSCNLEQTLVHIGDGDQETEDEICSDDTICGLNH